MTFMHPLSECTELSTDILQEVEMNLQAERCRRESWSEVIKQAARKFIKQSCPLNNFLKLWIIMLWGGASISNFLSLFVH